MRGLRFTNGSSLSFRECATLIRAEGRLGKGHLIDDEGLRCTVGVLEQWNKDQRTRTLTPRSIEKLNDVVRYGNFLNWQDDLPDSNRAATVAALFDELGEAEDAAEDDAEDGGV